MYFTHIEKENEMILGFIFFILFFGMGCGLVAGYSIWGIEEDK